MCQRFFVLCGSPSRLGGGIGLWVTGHFDSEPALMSSESLPVDGVDKRWVLCREGTLKEPSSKTHTEEPRLDHFRARAGANVTLCLPASRRQFTYIFVFPGVTPTLSELLQDLKTLCKGSKYGAERAQATTRQHPGDLN